VGSWAGGCLGGLRADPPSPPSTLRSVAFCPARIGSLDSLCFSGSAAACRGGPSGCLIRLLSLMFRPTPPLRLPSPSLSAPSPISQGGGHEAVAELWPPPGPASPFAARQPHVRVVALAQRAPTTVPGDLSCCTRALGSQQFPSEGLVSRRCGTGGASARPPREQHSALSQAEASASFAWVAAAPENPRPDLRSGQPVRLLPVPPVPEVPPSSAQSGLHPLSRTPLLRPAHVPLRAFVSLRRIVGTCCRSRGGGAAAASTCRWVASRPAAAPPPAPPTCPFALSVHRAGTHSPFPFLPLSFPRTLCFASSLRVRRPRSPSPKLS